MTWQCYKLSFRAESDVSIGFQKLGFIQRTRYYCPPRNLWAVTTDRWTRKNASESGGVAGPLAFQEMGATVDQHARFSTLFVSSQGRVQLPWAGDDTDEIQCLPPRRFESNFVASRARTAVDPEQNTVETGSLFEVEYIRARDDHGPLDWVGYVWLKAGGALDIDTLASLLKRISIGGERCYGMGRLRLQETPARVSSVFGFATTFDSEHPLIELGSGSAIPAHLRVEGCPPGMRIEGDIEPLQGRVWDDAKGAGRAISHIGWCWVPGSRVSGPGAGRGGSAGQPTTLAVGSLGVLQYASMPGLAESVPPGS